MEAVKDSRGRMNTSGRSNSISANGSIILVQSKKHLGSIDFSGLEAANARHSDLSLLACSVLTALLFLSTLIVLFLAIRGHVLRIFAIRTRVSGRGFSERSVGR
jgi:hypothetical protein